VTIFQKKRTCDYGDPIPQKKISLRLKSPQGDHVNHQGNYSWRPTLKERPLRVDIAREIAVTLRVSCHK
jgi:hypothetical protein